MLLCHGCRLKFLVVADVAAGLGCAEYEHWCPDRALVVVLTFNDRLSRTNVA